jgi:cell division protein FtsW (lipid II flippase)
VATHVSTSYYIVKQLLAVGLSIVAFVVVAKIPLNRWRKSYKPLLILAVGATLVALVLPVSVEYPAHRWIRFGGISFQTVELLKFAVLVWLAAFLSERISNGAISDTGKTFKTLFIAVLIIGFIVAGIQSDLGSAGVIAVMMGTMVFVAGLPFKRILMVAGVIIIGTMLAVVASPYRLERLNTYLHPDQNCQNAGYQACQAIIAVGSGGLAGLGLGRSVQAYGYVPEAANDSIFAIYAEKFGFVGSIILLGLFTALFGKLKSIAERAPDDFSRLLVSGILSWLSVQTLVNVGAMIGLLPLKGITLPFISYGGTSVVFVAAAMGLVFQISRYTYYTLPHGNRSDRRSFYDDSRNRRRIRRAYNPSFSSRV